MIIYLRSEISKYNFDTIFNTTFIAASSSPQTDAAKAEAEAIISAMQTVKFDHQPALEENATVSTVLKDMKKFVRPLDKLNKDLKGVSGNIAETRERLKDLRNQSDYSIATSKKANEIGNKIKDAKFSVKLGLLEEKASNMLEGKRRILIHNSRHHSS